MLHYNYSSLSHLLNYHQLEDQQVNDNDTTNNNKNCEDLSQQEDDRCRSNSSSTTTTTNHNKSFTIAAILGLKTNDQDAGVVNLSLHHHHHHHHQADSIVAEHTFLSACNRLQFPLRHNSTIGVTTPTTTTPTAVTTTTPVGHGCTPQQRPTVRGLKHHNLTATSTTIQNKKSCKGKRVRTIFTPEQLERLEAEFERQQYMVGPERLYLAHTLQLTEAQVKVWFQNRRIKWRKHHLELTHQRLAVLKQQQQLLLDETASHPDIQDTNSSSTDNT